LSVAVVARENLERLSRWQPARPDPADAAQVLAMPLVLHIEKTDPPGRQALVEAAARATVLACLDPRAAADGPWAADFDAWCSGRIRKIARRARGVAWAAVGEVEGVTVEQDGAQARAFVPGPVGEVDRRIGKLQIGGTEVDGELATEAPPRGLRLFVAPNLPMTVGKLAAQVSHASMLGAACVPGELVNDWYADGCRLAVVQAGPRNWETLLAEAAAGEAVAVRDAGYTEVAPGSCTVIAQWR